MAGEKQLQREKSKDSKVGDDNDGLIDPDLAGCHMPYMPSKSEHPKRAPDKKNLQLTIHRHISTRTTQTASKPHENRQQQGVSSADKTPYKDDTIASSASGRGAGALIPEKQHANHVPRRDSAPAIDPDVLRARAAMDMEARTRVGRAEMKKMKGHFREKDTYTQEDWDYFRVWMRENAERKAAERRKLKGK